jgi:hypothetical protein
MRLRAEAAAQVERLLAFLVETDGPEDVELNGDEFDNQLAGLYVGQQTGRTNTMAPSRRCAGVLSTA